jgi:hypothetical protein
MASRGAMHHRFDWPLHQQLVPRKTDDALHADLRNFLQGREVSGIDDCIELGSAWL